MSIGFSASNQDNLALVLKLLNKDLMDFENLDMFYSVSFWSYTQNKKETDLHEAITTLNDTIKICLLVLEKLDA